MLNLRVGKDGMNRGKGGVRRGGWGWVRGGGKKYGREV